MTPHDTTETHRHQCEIRQVLRRRTEGEAEAWGYLDLVKEKRGMKAYNRLKDECAAQWQKGNRGAHGDWR